MIEEHRQYVRSLPVMRLTPEEFTKLGEYSGSLPTGTTPGKMWRRLDGDFDLELKRQGGSPLWMIGQYDPNCPEDAPRIAIHWYRPVITLVADIPFVVMRDSMMSAEMLANAAARNAFGVKDPLSYMMLTSEIREWFYEQGYIPRKITYSRIYFDTRDQALEFKMRWY